ncbi:MAG TPA: hypothetical protein VF625_15850, partial [Longimicrobium sp.]
PYHPALRRAAHALAALSLAGAGLTVFIDLAGMIGWVGKVAWLSQSYGVVLTALAVAGTLEWLAKISPDSLTRHMRRASAVLLPLILPLAADQALSVDLALAALIVFGIAYTVDTQTGFRAWSRDRWLATGGSLGFFLLIAGVAGPGAPNWVAIASSWPLLMLAVGSGLRLWEDDAARASVGSVPAPANHA